MEFPQSPFGDIFGVVQAAAPLYNKTGLPTCSLRLGGMSGIPPIELNVRYADREYVYKRRIYWQ
jgi:hypothetical protein